MPQRPPGTCVIHLPPRPGYAWRRADQGYKTCSACYDQMHKWLSPLGVDAEGRPDNIPYLYLLLDPRPGSHGSGRRAPGFASRSPANDRVIAMGDPRTAAIEDEDPCSASAVLRQWVLWVWEERYDDEALGHEDYREQRRRLPAGVTEASMWLDRQLDWITRAQEIGEFYAELSELRRQLRSATGAGGQPPVGYCIEMLADGRCRAPIFMPVGMAPRAPDEPIATLPELRCPACDSRYTGLRLLRLYGAEEQKANLSAGLPAA